VPTIEIISGKHAGNTYPFVDSTKVGKDETCQIRLTDAGVSRFHAEFFTKGGTAHVKDLGSSNGTYVNFKKRGKEEVSTLDDQDIVFFGRTVTKFWKDAPVPTGGVSRELLESTAPIAGQPQEVQLKARIREAQQVEVIRRLRLHEVDQATVDRLISKARS
jgi:pSer/pThr/pTyr-binding forkhead associated (FHA) protein